MPALTPCLAFPPSLSVCLGTLNRYIRIWDVRSGENIHVFKGHMAAVTGLKFRPGTNTVRMVSLLPALSPGVILALCSFFRVD